jgi:tripartite-type tricarboxylate transporter receptor subunit TctC
VTAKSVQELIALAKAKPGALSYAVGPIGSSSHLAAELFRAMAGIDAVRVRYKGGSPALNDLIGGQLQWMFPNAPSVAGHIKSGRLRGLAVSSAKPSALAPDLPTVAASGLPGYEAASISGLWTQAKTPPAIIARLNQEVVAALNKADVKEKLLKTGSEVVASTPQQMAATIASETRKWGKLISDLGIRED